MENFNFFWKNKYGESDLNVMGTVIKNVEFSLLRIMENNKNLEMFWERIGNANRMSEELLSKGHLQIEE
jgi:hypothetical protein